jgi:hypothetical protein
LPCARALGLLLGSLDKGDGCEVEYPVKSPNAHNIGLALFDPALDEDCTRRQGAGAAGREVVDHDDFMPLGEKTADECGSYEAAASSYEIAHGSKRVLVKGLFTGRS